jgi:hypothetical protein
MNAAFPHAAPNHAQLKRYGLTEEFLNFAAHGRLQEWFNWRAWKVRVPQKGTQGSNP